MRRILLNVVGVVMMCAGLAIIAEQNYEEGIDEGKRQSACNEI